MRARLLLLLCGVSMLASCQTSRSAFVSRPFRNVVDMPSDTARTVVILHDSQGPQGTRVALTAAQAAEFSQQ
ncbi:hypothetical protein [Hymenobacter wooponensis]|uniref:Uncharacterized protein n=1 Tax=Hymenobacter wooponensis TaxID=1525360 RepID=A0A4Z0MPP9_9BACT|nr:hypothetical protein [Hymenobacter wooponensis]TGD81773.1 hypothetical protein EU557_09570 [Hymenobacter wooponensis]